MNMRHCKTFHHKDFLLNLLQSKIEISNRGGNSFLKLQKAFLKDPFF